MRTFGFGASGSVGNKEVRYQDYDRDFKCAKFTIYFRIANQLHSSGLKVLGFVCGGFGVKGFRVSPASCRGKSNMFATRCSKSLQARIGFCLLETLYTGFRVLGFRVWEGLPKPCYGSSTVGRLLGQCSPSCGLQHTGNSSFLQKIGCP